MQVSDFQFNPINCLAIGVNSAFETVENSITKLVFRLNCSKKKFVHRVSPN